MIKTEKWKIWIFLIFITIYLLQVFAFKNDYTDFDIYSKMYKTNIYEWYTWYNSLYYTPFFYILFYPFQYSLLIYHLLQSIICLILIYNILYKYKTYWALFITPWFFLDLGTSNFDIFITFFVFYILNKRTNWAGLILGILLFKPIVIYIIPFISYIYFTKINKILGINFKKIIIGFIIGGTINFGYFIFDMNLIPIYIYQLTCQTHPWGYFYLIGIQYPWIWYTIVFTGKNISEFLQIKKRWNMKSIPKK